MLGAAAELLVTPNPVYLRFFEISTDTPVNSSAVVISAFRIFGEFILTSPDEFLHKFGVVVGVLDLNPLQKLLVGYHNKRKLILVYSWLRCDFTADGFEVGAVGHDEQTFALAPAFPDRADGALFLGICGGIKMSPLYSTASLRPSFNWQMKSG